MALWDQTVDKVDGSGKVLKDLVVRCCKDAFGMKNEKTSPINIVNGNIPNDLDAMNKHKKVVQLEYHIAEVDTKNGGHQLLYKWNIKIDVDGKDPNDKDSKAHFGFTIDDGKSKVTGHLFFKNEIPPFVRPPLKDIKAEEDWKKKLQQVAFGGGKDKKGGPDNKGTIYYEHSGIWFQLK